MRSLIRHPDSCPPPALRHRPGFTLIELMIVVAIIAILIPSLARAREQAKIIKCMANMKAMSMGVLTFSEDHNELRPAYGDRGRVAANRFVPQTL